MSRSWAWVAEINAAKLADAAVKLVPQALGVGVSTHPPTD